ncbi:MAG: sulfotransferase [Actinomycetota bacterium]|nr:sulfotransferase [Actinomycetota bacterium]
MLGSAKKFLKTTVETVRSGTNARAAAQLAMRDAEISTLKKELAAAKGEAGTSLATPVFFVLGQQKSGTTWLMRMLDAHPEILCRGEGRFFGDWRQKGLKRRDTSRPPSSLHHALLDAEYLRLWVERSVWSREGDTRAHLDNITRLSVDYFLKARLHRSGKRLVGDKSPLLTLETMAEVGEIYPEARVIHIIRDGRDAAVSAAHHSWNFGNLEKKPELAARRDAYLQSPSETKESIFAPGQLKKLASDWNGRVGHAVEDGSRLLGGNYAEVRYEDLVEHPEREMRRLLLFLGAGADESSVERCVEAASFEKLTKGRERGQEDPSSFFRKGVVGDWKNVFSDHDKSIFKEEAGELLIRLGYEKDGNW